MHSRLLFLSLTIALATSAFACTTTEPIPDAADGAQYRSTADDGELPDPEGDVTTEPGGEDTSGDLRAIGPVATVNGHEISADAFNEQASDFQAISFNIPPEERGAIKEHFKESILDNLISRALIETAIQEAGISVDPADLDARIQEFEEEFAEMDDSVSFEEYLAYQGLSPELFREVMEETIALELLLEARGYARPSEEEVQAFYQEHPERFHEEESVDLHLIFIPDSPEAEETARELREAIASGEISPEDAIQEHPGQRIERLTRDEIELDETELAESIFALEPGQTSEPIRIDEGWYIARVDAQHEERTIPFSEVEDVLEEELYYLSLHEGLDSLLAELRDNADIEIHEENII